MQTFSLFFPFARHSENRRVVFGSAAKRRRRVASFSFSKTRLHGASRRGAGRRRRRWIAFGTFVAGIFDDCSFSSPNPFPSLLHTRSPNVSLVPPASLSSGTVSRRSGISTPPELTTQQLVDRRARVIVTPTATNANSIYPTYRDARRRSLLFASPASRFRTLSAPSSINFLPSPSLLSHHPPLFSTLPPSHRFFCLCLPSFRCPRRRIITREPEFHFALIERRAGFASVDVPVVRRTSLSHDSSRISGYSSGGREEEVRRGGFKRVENCDDGRGAHARVVLARKSHRSLCRRSLPPSR